MHGGQNTPVDRGIVERLEAAEQHIRQNPELSRRAFIGLGALTLLEASVALVKSRSRVVPVSSPVVKGISGVREVAVPVTTTTMAPPPPETVPPQPEAPHKEPNPAPPRGMSFEEYDKNAELFHSRLPNLEKLNKLFPSTAFFHFIPEQYAHINMLREQVNLTPEEFIRCSLNTTFDSAFDNKRTINPRMFMWHWTGDHYNDPQDMANKIFQKASVQLYVHSDDVPYQLGKRLNFLAGHAQKELNDIAIGMEVYSGVYDRVHSPLFSFTPGRTRAGIYTAVRALREVNLPINRSTLVGHYTADLIFRNPYYDPYTGDFHEVPGYDPPTVRKFDPPQEFMDMVVEKAILLDAALGPRG